MENDIKTFEKFLYVKTIFQTLFEDKKDSNMDFQEGFFQCAKKKFNRNFENMLKINEIFDMGKQLRKWERSFKKNGEFSGVARKSIEKLYEDFQKNSEFYLKLSAEVKDI